MGGVVSGFVGSVFSSLAQNILLLPHHRYKERLRIQHQQHDKNEKPKIVMLGQQPDTLNFCGRFCSALLCFSTEEIGETMSRILGSILSPLAPNLLLPHNRQIQMQEHQQKQHIDNSKTIKIVVVDRKLNATPGISLLAIAEGEDTIHTINYGPSSVLYPLAGCHGMFLSRMHKTPTQLAICNPTSKKDMIKTILPQSSVPRPPRVEHELVRTCGFGFDPSSNDYKVIRFLEFEFFEEDDTSERNNYWLVEVYSLKTNSWKQISYPHGDDVGYAGWETVCVYINGFWYTRANGDRLVIIPFDLANETFSPALIPGPPNTCKSSFKLVVFDGSHLAVIAYQYMPFEFELWVWNNDESWSLRGAWANIGDPDIGYIPRGQFVNNGVVFLQNSKAGLVLFDCAKQTLKSLAVYPDPVVKVYPYVENIESEIKSQS